MLVLWIIDQIRNRHYETLNGLNPMKTKILIAACVFGLLIMQTPALSPETFVTKGRESAAMDLQPLKKIFDLMVSPRPSDEKLLSGNIRTFFEWPDIQTESRN